MQRHLPWIFLVLLTGLLLSSCDEESTTAPPEPPNIVFTPATGSYTITALDSLLLSVEVLDGRPHTTTMLQDSVLVTTADSLSFIGVELGLTTIDATVTVGEFESKAQWQINVVEAGLPPVPLPTNLVIETGDLPGSVKVRWDRPSLAPEMPRLIRYDVAYSRFPFEASAFDEQAMLSVDDVSATIRQRTVVSGLEERVLYHFRVRSIDEVARASEPGSIIAFETTGHFDISGQFTAMQPVGAPTPLMDVVVNIDGVLTVSGIDGRFTITNIPDTDPVLLAAEEMTGGIYYELEIPGLEPVSRDLQVTMLPVSTVPLTIDDVAVDLDMLEFFLAMTGNKFGTRPRDFVPWESYPVTIYVHEYTQSGAAVGGDSIVSYHQSFQRGVDLWNAGATGEDRLMKIEWLAEPFDPAANPGAVGAYYSANLPPSGGTVLGEVSYVQPIGGVPQVDVPELLIMELRAEFNRQAVADWVIVHELGHVVGLSHSPNDADLIMHESTRGTVPRPAEILAARFLRYIGPDAKTDWFIPPQP